MNNKERELTQIFSERLKKIRTERGLSTSEVAKRCNIHRSTYSGYETQNRYAPFETLPKLAKALNTSTDYLLGITNDPAPRFMTLNLHEFIDEYKNIHWDGIPLSDSDLQAFYKLFDMVMSERLKNMKLRQTLVNEGLEAECDDTFQEEKERLVTA